METEPSLAPEKVAIIDAGSQYTKLIENRVRDL
jgi:GMP synthase-like glutamine amidotransferase